MDITIQKLTTYNEVDFNELYTLMQVLTANKRLTHENLKETIEKSHIFVARKETHIVGCASICIFSAPTGRKASIEDVVVHPQEQGQGIARALMNHIMEFARLYSPITLQLTSRPMRIAANQLYQKLGLQRKDTNFYEIIL